MLRHCRKATQENYVEENTANLVGGETCADKYLQLKPIQQFLEPGIAAKKVITGVGFDHLHSIAVVFIPIVQELQSLLFVF